jgi:hypothetical protein
MSTAEWTLAPGLHHSSPTLLVIFGAGASFDSADRELLYQTRGLQPPPLAKDLVADRFNGIAASLPNSLPSRGRSDASRRGHRPSAYGPRGCGAARAATNAQKRVHPTGDGRSHGREDRGWCGIRAAQAPQCAASAASASVPAQAVSSW